MKKDYDNKMAQHLNKNNRNQSLHKIIINYYNNHRFLFKHLN